MFFQFKMASVLWNLEQLGPDFALHSGAIQDMYLQNVIGISEKLRALQNVGPPPPRKLITHFGSYYWLQTNQTHIGPKLHVGPN